MLVDLDDTIIEVHGYAKQVAGFGYTKVRGLNALIATVTTEQAAPVIVAQRLRKGSCGSPRGAARMVADALAPVRRLRRAGGAQGRMLAPGRLGAAIRAAADVSITLRQDKRVKTAIATIAEDAWTPINYTDAILDEQTSRWISRAEVAEIPFLAFIAKKKADQVHRRLVVRRIPT